MKPRIIIVEGPDNCGKSTLAKTLALRLGGHYWHMTSGKGLEEKDAMALYQKDAMKNAVTNLEMGKTTVFDRLFISDQIYGSIIRDGPAISASQCMGWIKEHNVLIIFCTRFDAVKAHESNQDPDHPYDAELFARIVGAYEAANYSYEEQFPKQVITYVLDNFLDRPEQLTAFIAGLSAI